MTRILPPRKTMHIDADALEADLRLWKVSPAIGLEIAKAMQHSGVVYQEFYKAPANDIYKVVLGLLQVRSDPNAAPENDPVRKAWTSLPEAPKQLVQIPNLL